MPLELQRLAWDEPLAALAQIDRIRGTSIDVHPPMLADLEVRARLRSGADLERAEAVAREIADHRGDASALEQLAEVLKLRGKVLEAAECMQRAEKLPNRMLTKDVLHALDALGLRTKFK